MSLITHPYARHPSMAQTGQAICGLILIQAAIVAPVASIEAQRERVSTAAKQAASTNRAISVVDQLSALLSDESIICPHISASTVRRAYDFSSQVPAVVPLPHLTASDDGEIGLTWHNGGDRFLVRIDDDAVAWTRKIAGKRLPGFDIHDTNPASFEAVYQALAEFYGISRSVSV